jgi:excisionase family DNA binding protein
MPDKKSDIQSEHHWRRRACMTPMDAAIELQLSLETVRIMLRKKELPGRKIGNLWRIRTDEFEEYLKNSNPGQNGAA